MNGNLYANTNLSQVDTILQHLIIYGKITPEESINLYDIKFLSKCISRLKQKNIKIYSVFCDSEKRLDSKIKEYVLGKEQEPPITKMIETLRNNHLKKTA
ncbi:hypothetical protein IJ750_02690 [bacterium]|nr:hypothetical protein [bacterium]